MKQMKFNLPKGWSVNFENSELMDVEGDWLGDTQEYEINPGSDKLFTKIHISKWIDILTVDPSEHIVEMASDFLNRLEIPNALRSLAPFYVDKFLVGETTVYYYIEQEPRENPAIIKMVFEDPTDGQLVFADAYIKDDEDIGLAVLSLSEFFDFS